MMVNMGGGGGSGGSFNSSGSSSGNESKNFEEKEKIAREKIRREFDNVENQDDDKTEIFLSHQNRDGAKTQRAHEFGDYLEESGDFIVKKDTGFFPKKQIANLSEINNIISDNLRDSDMFVALYHRVKDSNRHERSEWYNLEANKAKYWGKPIVHVFLDGSHDSGVVESSKSYKIHYKKDSHWKEDLTKQLKIIAKKHITKE
ncbi:hypothetical protein [Candidatus Lokiarchaeum ossiferum]|uniref:hypothetical protein n=1 Tax=Candidatus Lokiarchaeum ossiferum TaxID=2951803 RepID=UPI00352ED9F8